MTNCFYAFEGIDGCGKTTLINALQKRLVEKSFYFTKEPCGTNFNPHIKELLCTTILEHDYIAQYLLFAAERSYHIKTIINPFLQNNYSVISDRFFYSSLVYQGMNVDENFIHFVYENSNHGLIINKIFYCKISSDIALERIKKRNINDTFDQYYEDKLCLLSSRYDMLFENNTKVIVLDMIQPLELLVKRVIQEIVY